MVVLTLPYPISSNRYWRPVRIGAHITIVPTKEAKQYKADVQRAARIAGVSESIKGRVELFVSLYPNLPKDAKKRMRDHGAAWDDTVQCLDLDNALKVVIDAIKDVVIEDDKWVRRITATREEPIGEAKLVLRVVPIALAQSQLELPVQAVQPQLSAVDAMIERSKRAPDPFAIPADHPIFTMPA